MNNSNKKTNLRKCSLIYKKKKNHSHGHEDRSESDGRRYKINR